MAKNRTSVLDDFDAPVETASAEAIAEVTQEQEVVEDAALSEEERHLYDRCFDTGIQSIISACGNLGGVTSKEIYVRSLIRQNFLLCDLMIEEHRKFRRK